MLPDLYIEPFFFGPFYLYPFGILLGLGMVTGWWTLMWSAKRVGLRTDIAGVLIVLAFCTGTIGSHLFDVLFYNPADILQDPWILLDLPAGLSSFGSFLGAFAGGVIYLKIKKQPVWPYSDAVMICFLVGWFFGRIGCTVAFDHPGVLTDSILGMPYNGPLASPGLRHNLGLYEVPWTAALLAYFYTQRNKPHFVGWVTSLTVLTYMPIRFGLDFLRVAEPTRLGLTPGQFVACILFFCCFWLYGKKRGSGYQLVPGAAVHTMADGSPLPQKKQTVPTGQVSRPTH